MAANSLLNVSIGKAKNKHTHAHADVEGTNAAAEEEEKRVDHGGDVVNEACRDKGSTASGSLGSAASSICGSLTHLGQDPAKTRATQETEGIQVLGCLS